MPGMAEGENPGCEQRELGSVLRERSGISARIVIEERTCAVPKQHGCCEAEDHCQKPTRLSPNPSSASMRCPKLHNVRAYLRRSIGTGVTTPLAMRTLPVRPSRARLEPLLPTVERGRQPCHSSAGVRGLFPSSHSGTGKFFERRNCGLNSFDW